MRFFLVFCSFFMFMSCAIVQPKQFSDEALKEELLTLDRTPISLKEILAKNSEKEKFVQIFATYCPVSQDSFYDVLAFQKENPDKAYIFLSVDHSYHDWKRGVKDIKPKGQFYYMQQKDEGALGKFLKLKTIPRFLNIDKKGNIKVFKKSQVSKKLE